MPVEMPGWVDRLPGLYEHLRERTRRDIEYGDPRVWLGVTDDAAERTRLSTKSPVVLQLRSMLAKLDAGEPVTIPSWQAAGHSFPAGYSISWIAGHLCDEIVVTPDDTVRPAPRRRNGR